MDIISFNEASTANGRIESFIENPDSTSGIVTVPKVIASGENITIPAGRVAVLPNVQVDGTLNIEGEVFIPSGATFGDLESQIASKVSLNNDEVIGGVKTFSSSPKIPDATQANEAVAKGQLDGVLSSLVTIPTGFIIANSSNTIPTGFLECNGATISRSTYSDLFSKIGTLYGAGDGSTTFKIPDLRGEFIRGFDNGRGIDSGRAIGSWQADEFKSHRHTFGGGYPNVMSMHNTDGQFDFDGVSRYANYWDAYYRSMDYVGGSETRPRNIAMMYCIKY